uniref:Lipase domain-containing protein n=1 Tax=Photinus pyralis TaxID=7054 RepID=A0A1Y1JTM4_PHOPY
MKALLVSILLCFSVNLSVADLCSYNFTLDDLPNGVTGDIWSIIANSLIYEITNCSSIEYAGEKIDFWLYTRGGTPDGVKVNSGAGDTSILKGKKTIVLMHGFLCSHKNNLIPELKDAYLKKYDANVIAIDWSAYSMDVYAKVFCNVPRIAETTAKFLCKADSEQNIDIESLHVVGHSMGGQLAGLTGQETQAQCSKLLGRISGLDPAGPLYSLKSKSRRLDASDAKEVMVSHTNQGLLGYAGNCGTADYYPNFGIFQEGCSVFNSPSSSVFDKLAYPAVCSHLRAVDYMIESINSDSFYGKSCFWCSSCLANPFTGTRGVMGEHFTYAEAGCSYYMDTNAKSPYGKGSEYYGV